MKVPAEFEDVFQGVELTEREIGFLTWLAGWDIQCQSGCPAVVGGGFYGGGVDRRWEQDTDHSPHQTRPSDRPLCVYAAA